ncbi:hypothetical protein JHK85_001874 [Glycine max]|nr:hypothetical protein JHK85_001874 [Glycine max]
MALEMGTHKIRVNSISPLLFKSEITANLMQKHWLNDVAMKTVPLRKYDTSDPALTSLARYLIHDSSEYVSGNNFVLWTLEPPYQWKPSDACFSIDDVLLNTNKE